MANVLGELFQDIADAIRSKTGNTDTLKPNEFPAAIEGITAGGGGSSGDSRVKYVTFKSGERELIKYPVISGDTCRDPVVNGYISEPTKESTVQHNYTYAGGWSSVDGISSDPSILENIKQDKTVYAAFYAEKREYTITWLDDDGVTVLNTTQVAYGSTPSYTPTKADVVFDKWIPTPTAVTGDTSYTAQWRSPTVVYIANEQSPAFSLNNIGKYYATWSYIKANLPGKRHACVVTWDGVEYSGTLLYNATYTYTDGKTYQYRYSVGNPTVSGFTHSTYIEDAPFFFYISVTASQYGDAWVARVTAESGNKHTFSIRLLS